MLQACCICDAVRCCSYKLAMSGVGSVLVWQFPLACPWSCVEAQHQAGTAKSLRGCFWWSFRSWPQAAAASSPACRRCRG
jgi:hypothetical protein